MEASSTTINISNATIAETPTTATHQVETKHSHGPNFGRYVEGCAACIAKYPNGPQKRTRTAKPATDKDAEIARLKAELSKSYTQQVEKTSVPDDVNRELANIMLRRETRQLREEEATESRKAQARAEWLVVEQEQERKTKARQDNCSHTKPNGQTARIGSQIHNNGMIRPFCPHCGKLWAWQRPSHEQMPTSIDG